MAPRRPVRRGRIILDPILDEADAHSKMRPLQKLCDARAKGSFFNLIREFGDIEYITSPHSESLSSSVRNDSDDVAFILRS